MITILVDLEIERSPGQAPGYLMHPEIITWLIPEFLMDQANKNYTNLFELHVNQIVKQLSCDARWVSKGRQSRLHYLPKGLTQVVPAMHWPGHLTCFRIDSDGTILFVDSLPNVQRKRFAKKLLRALATLFDLTYNWDVKKWSFKYSTPTTQNNSDDCGVFAVANIVALVQNQDMEVHQSPSLADRFSTLRRWRWLMLLTKKVFPDAKRCSSRALKNVLDGVAVPEASKVVKLYTKCSTDIYVNCLRKMFLMIHRLV
jgi:hypothetical protein